MRVMLVDDSVLLREGAARLLGDFDDIEVVDQAGDTATLSARVAMVAPDLVVLDIRMPPTYTTEGLEAAALIRRDHPEVAVVVVSQYVEADAAAELVATADGRFGYLLKDRITDIDTFVDSLRQVTAGGTVIDPELVRRLVRRQRIDSPIDRLTAREREVLGAMAEGRSNSGIASALDLNPKTVESHVRSIFTKLDLRPEPDDHRRVQAVVTWLDHA